MSRKRKNSRGGDPLLEDERPERLGGEVDGSAAKSYLSSLREPWHQAPPAGPLLKPAWREDAGHVNCSKCRDRHE